MFPIRSSLTYNVLGTSFLWLLQFGKFFTEGEKERKAERTRHAWVAFEGDERRREAKGTEKKMKVEPSSVTTARAASAVRVKGSIYR